MTFEEMREHLKAAAASLYTALDYFGPYDDEGEPTRSDDALHQALNVYRVRLEELSECDSHEEMVLCSTDGEE